MDEIYSEIVKGLAGKEKLVLATLITRVGSAPRAVGAKYLVKKEGASFGSIGGGCVEAEVWQEAQKVIAQGKSTVLRFNLTSEQLAEGGLICGGNIEIFLEPMKEEFLGIYQEVVRIRQRGGAAILATVISEDPSHSEKGSKALIRPSGEKIGSLPFEELHDRILKRSGETLSGNRPVIMRFDTESATSPWRKMEVLLEPVLSEPTVYIFGGGHISQQLVSLVKRVSFKVVVIDDREIFANRDHFPEADEIIVSEFERCFEQLHIDEAGYIVIVTRGHLYDGLVLEQAVKTSACYIGMIGSRKKIKTLYQGLIEKGVTRETLNRVFAPIGLEINSETPEEIAVSIVAQLIKVRGEPVHPSR